MRAIKLDNKKSWLKLHEWTCLFLRLDQCSLQWHQDWVLSLSVGTSHSMCWSDLPPVLNDSCQGRVKHQVQVSQAGSRPDAPNTIYSAECSTSYIQMRIHRTDISTNSSLSLSTNNTILVRKKHDTWCFNTGKGEQIRKMPSAEESQGNLLYRR